MYNNTTPDYLIIGSGIAALSVSALLVKAGYKVTMLEAHATAGGYAHTFEVDHFQFCAQVHYIWGCAPGQTIYEFLKKLDLHNDVTFRAFDPAGYDIAALPDGKRVGIPYGFERLLKNLDVAYPGQRINTQKFLAIISQLKHEISQLPRHVHWWHLLTKCISARTVIRYRNHTLQQVFDECHLSKEIQAILCCQAGDFGSPPETLSVLAYTALFGGYNEGAYYPAQHFKYFIDRLTKVITSAPDCNIIYNAKVVQINIDKNRVSSVTTSDGKTYLANKFICNMDPQHAASMVGFDKVPAAFHQSLKYEYSPSSFIIYLGLKDIDLRDHGFSNANIWHLSQWDMNTMFREQLAGNFSKPWLFISSPFLRTPDLTSTPPGCQNLEFGTLCNYDQFSELYQHDHDAYKNLKNNLAEQFIDVLEQLYVPTIRKHIISKTIGTPITNENFCGAAKGSCYGSMMTPKNMGLSRLQATSPWENLFWCNASAGYAGTNGTISTGINLYSDLTGDRFLPTGAELPSSDDCIKYAVKHSFSK
jgi:phytoene dehydrogenase-like protein